MFVYMCFCVQLCKCESVWVCVTMTDPRAERVRYDVICVHQRGAIVVFKQCCQAAGSKIYGR